MSYFTLGDIPKKDLNLVKDQIEIQRDGNITYYRRKDLDIDPEFFREYLISDTPPMINPNRARCVQKVESPRGELYVKRFHYHRTYRKKHRWFFGYRFQRAYGPTYLSRALTACERGHPITEPLLAARWPSEIIRQESLVVMRPVEGTPLKNIFRDPKVPVPQKLSLLKKTLRSLFKMHLDKIAYGDTKIRHILINQKNQPNWIDFDKIQIDTKNRLLFLDDLRRLLVTAANHFVDSEIDREEFFSEIWEVYLSTTHYSGTFNRLLRFQCKRRI